MEVPFNELVKETSQAILIKHKHNQQEYNFWIPKSLIENDTTYKKDGVVSVPDWFYDKKIDEILDGET